MKKINFSKNFYEFSKSFCSVETKPTIVAEPKLLLWSKGLGDELHLHADLEIFSGNKIAEGSIPSSSRYGGHQFGHWASQLGDGRAILLGEIEGPNTSYEIQLKGAGETPFSRRGDGRAVFRSSIREFLCSEAMHFLNVPTTRALCCLLTGDKVLRDLFYDGNAAEEDGAITTRAAPSFLRFGHFEILAADGDKASLRSLIFYTIQRFYPECLRDHVGSDAVLSDHLVSDHLVSDTLIQSFFSKVSLKTIDLILEWMRVGFIHGVMNTDNMSILGLTIDYGPYGWEDLYDPDFTPNTTDRQHKRYRFSNQAAIAFWNLERLSEALSVASDEPESCLKGCLRLLQKIAEEYPLKALKMKAKKIGITSELKEVDFLLLKDLEELMIELKIDFTLFFRKLSSVLLRFESLREGDFYLEMESAYYENLNESHKEKMNQWFVRYFKRMQQESIDLKKSLLQIKEEMDKVNPYFILRNYIVQEAIEAFQEKKEESRLHEIYKALETPYIENEFTKPFFNKRPAWAENKPGCSALSCSS